MTPSKNILSAKRIFTKTATMVKNKKLRGTKKSILEIVCQSFLSAQTLCRVRILRLEHENNLLREFLATKKINHL